MAFKALFQKPMRPILLGICTFSCLVLPAFPVAASSVPSCQPLIDTYEQSDCVALAKVTSYTPDAKQLREVEKFTQSFPSKDSNGNDVTIGIPEPWHSFINVSGRYSFDSLTLIKGKAPVKLPATFPAIPFYAYPSDPIKPGDSVAIFLKKQGRSLVPTDNNLPMIKISPQASSGKTPNFYDILSHTLKDRELRAATMEVLYRSVSPHTVDLVAKYTEDDNLIVKDEALSALMFNNKSEYIPQVIGLAEEQARLHGGTRSVVALSALNEASAAPLLNPLLFHPDQYVRMNSLEALGNINKQGKLTGDSLPFLLIAIVDPESQNINGYRSYVLASQLLNHTVDRKNLDNFPTKSVDVAFNLTTIWAKSTPPRRRPLSSRRVDEELNPRLFRESARDKLSFIHSIGEKKILSAQPFLLLFLFDSNPDVAFSSAQTLSRFFKMPALRSKSDFEAHRKKFIVAAYQVWRHQLRQSGDR